MSTRTVLLIDGDIVAYQAAAASEVEINWGEGLWTLHSHFEEAQAKVEAYFERVRRLLGLEDEDVTIINTLTDGVNWRNSVLDTYKTNRADTRKPLALKELKQWMAEEYETFIRPNLEADDCMGILSTWDRFHPDARKIIVSEDKDLQTIPGYLFNPAKDRKPRLITEEEADLFHLTQALAGDATDGYDGCPSIGMETAAKILEDPYGWEQYEHTFKSGPRKDMTELRWRKREVDSLWEAIVDQYRKQGLGEAEALRQAQVARILRASDYDFKKKEPILWHPH